MSYMVVDEHRWPRVKDYYTVLANMDYVAIIKDDGTVDVFKNRLGGDKNISYAEHLENMAHFNPPLEQIKKQIESRSKNFPKAWVY